jgi:hypothetical protein
MAKKVQVLLVDGSGATETVALDLDGASHEIDLSSVTSAAAESGERTGGSRPSDHPSAGAASSTGSGLASTSGPRADAPHAASPLPASPGPPGRDFGRPAGERVRRRAVRPAVP